MTSTTSTFANQLRHFARAVDIVDDEIFDRVRQLIYRYVKTELGAAYFELMRDQPLDQEPALKMFWSSEDEDHLWPVRRPDGSYTNAVTAAFAEGQPMWVVNHTKGTLVEAEKLTDEWSHVSDLPAYRPVAEQSIRTLIVLPLRRKRRLGVCYFESSTHLGITDVAKLELQLLADAIAILLELYEVNRSQAQQTASAIFDLQERLESARFPKLTRPHFFLAFSNRADQAVINVISEVLHEFTDRLEFTDWTRMNESGNVNAQIAKEILRARFGICYLSEAAPEGHPAGTPYVDNPNVVFEAGMIHARTTVDDSSTSGDPTGWIPMREEASPPAPFDFAAERTLYIPRFGNGGLNEGRLRELLRARISNLLGEE
jgi:hypothetical protein